MSSPISFDFSEARNVPLEQLMTFTPYHIISRSHGVSRMHRVSAFVVNARGQYVGNLQHATRECSIPRWVRATEWQLQVQPDFVEAPRPECKYTSGTSLGAFLTEDDWYSYGRRLYSRSEEVRTLFLVVWSALQYQLHSPAGTQMSSGTCEVCGHVYDGTAVVIPQELQSSSLYRIGDWSEIGSVLRVFRERCSAELQWAEGEE